MMKFGRIVIGIALLAMLLLSIGCASRLDPALEPIVSAYPAYVSHHDGDIAIDFNGIIGDDDTVVLFNQMSGEQKQVTGKDIRALIQHMNALKLKVWPDPAPTPAAGGRWWLRCGDVQFSVRDIDLVQLHPDSADRTIVYWFATDGKQIEELNKLFADVMGDDDR